MDRLQFADIEVDLPGMRVRRAGQSVPLEPKAFDVLVCLARRPGRLVSKDELVREVWQGTAITDNAITRVVAQLRRSLGDDARHPRFIETVPTRGYRFVAELTGQAEVAGVVRSAMAEAGASGTADVGARAPEAVAWRWRGPWLLAAGGVTLLVVGAAALALVPHVGAVRPGADLPFSASLPAQITVSAGLDLFPSVSPDGTAIAYASDRSGRFEIVVKALAPGGSERAVTGDGQQNIQPAWSPDGRYLAYHSRVRGGLWLVPALGGAPRQLVVAGSTPSWSPDGEWIAYQTSAVTDLGPSAGSSLPPSTLALVRVATGERRALTAPGVPEGGHGMAAWWPDGSRVVFIRGGAMAQDVWTVPAAGGTPERLAPCRSACLDPFFGPDGALYLSDGRQPRLWRLPVDRARGLARGEMTAVTLPVGGSARRMSVSVNRRIAAFAVVQIRSNLVSVPVAPDGGAAGEAVRLTNDTSRRNTNPAFSPDGRRIAYTVARAGAAPDIWTIEADGSNPMQMTLDGGSEGGPQWSPDGREVLFKSYTAEARLSLRAMDVDSRRERSVFMFDPPGGGRLPGPGLEAFTLRAAPDLSAFVYTAVERGVPNVFLAPSGRGDARALTADREGAAFPVVSLRGDRVAVQLVRGDTTQLGLVPLAGGATTVVTAARGQTWINSWSPDGRFVAAAVLRDGEWNVATIDTSTGRERLLTRQTTPRVYVRYPDWARTGAHIVFEEAEVTGNIWVSRLGETAGRLSGIW